METLPTCLEVALNGPWGRARQPLMPVTPDALIAEGIACGRAGASVVHIHVYDPATGRQFEDFDSYARVIEGIRAAADVIVYPTLPLAGSPDAPDGMSPAARFDVMERLAVAGLIEWAVIDPGSVTIADVDDIAAGRDGFLYRNSEAELRHGLRIAARHYVHPSYAIYEPGFLRLGAAMAGAIPGPTPIYRFMFSDRFAFGFPPRDWALDAYLALLAETHPGAPWMIAGLQVDVTPLIAATVAAGGHVRVGLEDAPFGCEQGNAAQVADAARAIAQAGGTLAQAADLRAAWGPLRD